MRALVRDLAAKGAAVFAAVPRRRAAGARPGPSRNRRGLPDPGLLCDDRAAGGAARHRSGPAAPSAKGHAHPMTGRKLHAVAADTVFDGAALHRDGAVVIEGADIAALVPRRDLPPGIPLRAMPPGAWLAPGVHRRAGQWRRRRAVQRSSDSRRHRRDRRRASPLRHDRLAADPDQRHAARRCAGRARRSKRRCVSAPACSASISRGRSCRPSAPGVHDPAMFRAPDDADLALLTEQRGGATLVTLAPECVPSGFVASAGKSRRARRARAFDGDLRTDPRRAGRGADRVHASVQRDAAAAGARPRADRGGARRPAMRSTG